MFGASKQWMKAAVVGLAMAFCWPMVVAAGERAKAPVTGTVNLNTASPEQLELLPGVGEKTARLIVTFREKHRFTRVEDLVKVKGIGKKKFRKLKPHLAVTGETTLRAEEPEKESASERSEEAELERSGGGRR